MDVQVSYKTRKSHFYNEDRYLIYDNVFMVMDGATPLEKCDVKPSVASWFVSFVKKNLPKTKGNTMQRLEQVSREAYQLLKDKGVQSDNMPSAGLAWAEVYDDKITVYSVGDCEATVVLKDKVASRIVGQKLIDLDKIAIDKMVEISKNQGISPLKARDQITSLLIKHRNMANKPGGYPVFAPDKVGKFDFLSQTFALEQVDEVYLYTDGFADGFDCLGVFENHSQAFAQSLDVCQQVENITKACFDDPQCKKHPRFKKIDDITVIKLKF